MAQWTETLEPYVKVVKETVHTAALNPTAGEDLIIGVTFISDAGPAVPTLISSQSEFLSTYTSQDLTEEYLKSLNNLYEGDDKTTAATMWANAYRLAGSTTMLCCRASKASDIFYAKPLQKGDLNTYILRDGALLKKLNSFKIVLDIDKDDASHDQDGWSININGIGILGNRTTDEGAQYDYFVRTLPDLVEQMNETNKFFSPSYTFYTDEKGTVEGNAEKNPDEIISVIFNEVYVGQDLLATDDTRCPEGLQYVIICQPDWSKDNPNQENLKFDINDVAWSGFDAVNYYATNAFNSATDLRVRIRRFNHDAVASKELSSVTLNENSDSPWIVLTGVLDTFTKKGTQEPSEANLERDFYEVCVQDPSIADEPQFFNIGNILGRGDMTPAELNDQLKMIQLQLPDNMRDLNLNYYGYETDDNIWVEVDSDGGSPAGTVNSMDELYQLENPTIDSIYIVDQTPTSYKYYKYTKNGEDQIYVNLMIDSSETSLLNVNDSDLKKALDLIGLDEVYTTEGLCDLGNTEPSFQTYMANMAINQNYFYPISTVNSTNYMTIGNSASRISQDSYKLYMSAPWDNDTGTLGWQYYASPAVLYWEAVSRNRRNNNEFAPVMGQTNGIVQYQSPVAEFNKKTRQLLLSKKINTVLWNIQTNAWNMNDNYTKQSVDNIVSDEANSRLAIRIAKAMPTLLRQFIGWRITPRLWASATSVIDYWFKTSILSLNYNLDAYQIIIDETNNPVEVQRQNKLVVQLNVRFLRALKFVCVYLDIYDIGMEFDSTSSAI